MVNIKRRDSITSRRNQKIYYSDFTTNFDVDSNTGSLIKLTNEDAVKNSIKNLIFTDLGSRYYHNDIGSLVRTILFEPIDDITTNRLKSTIENTIRNFEPRVSNVTVTAVPNIQADYYDVTVFFTIINIPTPLEVNIILNRIR